MLSNLSPRSILQVLLSAVFGRMATALSQIVAAIYLTPTDFGIYAAANGIVAACTILRGGGTGNHVQTMTPLEFVRDSGRFFRYSFIFSLIGSVLSLSATWLVPQWFGAKAGYAGTSLTLTCLVLSAGFIASNLTVFPRASMIANLRLAEISAMDTFLGAVKLGSTWLLAGSGFGPTALAGALLICSTTESLWTWPRSGLRLANLRAEKGWLKPTFMEMRLPLVMALLASLNSQTDSFVSSAFLPAAVLGSYFFASQIATQPTMLVGNTLRSIFTATTAHVRGNQDRGSAAVRDVFSGCMVFMPLVCMAVPAVYDSFEKAAWQGKWADSRYPVLILSATLVYPTTLQLVGAPIAGLRDWRLAIRIDTLRAVSRIVPAVIACALMAWLDVTSQVSGIVLASAVGGASAIAASMELFRLLTRAGMPSTSVVYELYSTPLAALLSATAAAGLAHSMVEPLRIALGERPAAAVECAAAAVVYAVLALVLLRFGYTSTLERLIDALPEFMRARARAIFLL